MSATWIRAHEFGQPLRWTVIGVSISPSRVSSSSTTRAAWALVSTMASLQNSIPVQAITERRQAFGRADSPISSAPATRASTRSGATSRTRIFCIGVVRSRYDPCASARSARSISFWPPVRPAMGDRPTKKLPSFCSLTPTWSPGRSGVTGAGPSISLRFRYSFSSTSRNFSGPQSAIRNLIRARVRSRR